MKPQILAVCLSACMLFSGCANTKPVSLASSSENPATPIPSSTPATTPVSEDHVFSKYFQNLIENGAELPDYEIFSKPASENGKGDTEIVMFGKINKLYENSGLLIIDFLEGKDANPYALILGTYSSDLHDTYNQMLGKEVSIYGIYLGYSDILELPAVTLYDTECDGEMYFESYLNVISDGIAESAADYITMDEFIQINDGMTYDEVVSIIGKDGELSSSAGNVTLYTWYGQSKGAAAILFVDDAVLSKSQSGLE